ncbi:MAG: helix-turn-helix domain-containing protein [Parcubacteria group bacterium]
MKLQNTLEKLGFEAKEATLYTTLLELGEAGIVDIARKSGLKRTTVYHIVDNLKLRGLVSQTKKGKKVFYIAEDPHSIGQDLREKESLFQKTLPELLSIANLLEKKPVIKYFEGINGIKEAYKDHLKQGDYEMLGWWSESYNIFGDDFFYDYYMPERLKKKIWLRAIVPNSPYGQKHVKEDQKFLRKIKLADLDPTFAELDIHLYGNNKISINSFTEKFALIIESKALYNTLKNIFELQWKSLK